MKVLVLANCQARPVSAYLQASCPGIEVLEPVITHLSHNRDYHDHLERMQAADIIFSQFTTEGFRVGHVASDWIRERFSERTIVWLNLFYAGQQPYLRYVTETTSLTRLTGPLAEYHDLRVLADWYLDRHGEVPFTIPDPAAVARASIEQLRQRETDCDVAITDLIISEEKTRRLFFTFNHPSSWLLSCIIKRLVKHAGMPVPLKVPEFGEPIARIIPPSICADWDTSYSLRGPKVDLSKDPFVLPGPPCTYEPNGLRRSLFECYDHQSDLLSDPSKLRLTPHL